MTRHVPRVFCEQHLFTNTRVRLGEGTAHHLLHVLRLTPGAELVLFDGRGGEFAGTLAAAGGTWIEIEVGTHRPTARESALRVTLGQAVSRGERMDYTLQKAVELGVSEIQPLDSERSLTRLEPSRQEKKLHHWRAVVASAAEQSGREYVPAVHPVLPLANWLAALPDGRMKLLLDPYAGRGLTSLAATTEVCLLSGPEGGLSESEIETAIRSGFAGIRLGPRILRTETAAVACLAALQTLWGDLG